METLGIYIHIPFCRSKCAYCDFYSRCDFDNRLLDRYLAALDRQIEETFPLGGRYTADTIYIGGGTPSVMGGKRLSRLLHTLEKHVKIAKNPEITVEVNPESTDKALLKQLHAAGVNRLSMGVQSSDDGELRAIGRIHDFARVKDAAALMKQIGFTNISLDLMYGLPEQTMEGWQKSVEDVLALEPAHLSCYGLRLEEHTPLFQKRPVLPDDDLQAEMYLWAVDRLAKAGYAQYEISNFARSGLRARHNSKYWDLSPYVGLGCAAHSFYNGRRSKVVSSTEQYLAAYEGKGGRVLEDADDCSFINRIGEYIMLGLRTTDGISGQDFFNRFRQDFTPYEARLQFYRETGYTVCDGGRWYLTPKGFLVSNTIIGAVLDGACGEEETPRV
ncbi:MAG: radical SAM family heme chaperone HemW [Clostridiaceae bacterium]|nr:radical SAM family heme chaperone HemW [Clostridiaceae bacterium]